MKEEKKSGRMGGGIGDERARERERRGEDSLLILP